MLSIASEPCENPLSRRLVEGPHQADVVADAVQRRILIRAMQMGVGEVEVAHAADEVAVVGEAIRCADAELLDEVEVRPAHRHTMIRFADRDADIEKQAEISLVDDVLTDLKIERVD